MYLVPILIVFGLVYPVVYEFRYCDEMKGNRCRRRFCYRRRYVYKKKNTFLQLLYCLVAVKRGAASANRRI